MFYTQNKMTVHFQKTKQWKKPVLFLEILRVFSVFSHRPGTELFISVILPPWATKKSEQQYWYYVDDLETEDSTMLGSGLYLNRNTCSCTTLALSPSVLFCFIFFSVKIIWQQFQHSFPKAGECLYLAVEIQPLFRIAWEFNAKTT